LNFQVAFHQLWVTKMGLRGFQMAALAFVLVTGVSALAEKSQVTPIQKVLTLMEELKAKGIKEKNDEETRFSAFAQWCANTKKAKTGEIDAGNEKMEMLRATIEKARVLISQLTDRILELEEDVGRWKKDQKSATTVRDAERADYTATVTDYTESIDAVAGAISVLKKQAYDRKQAALIQSSLIQVRSLKLVPAASKRALTSFLQQDPELAYDAPEANAYEFQSGGVVDMLEKLNDEFSQKKTELEKDELAAQQAFEQIFQQLADNIENAEFEIARKPSTVLRQKRPKLRLKATWHRQRQTVMKTRSTLMTRLLSAPRRLQISRVGRSCAAKSLRRFPRQSISSRARQWQALATSTCQPCSRFRRRQELLHSFGASR